MLLASQRCNFQFLHVNINNSNRIWTNLIFTAATVLWMLGKIHFIILFPLLTWTMLLIHALTIFSKLLWTIIQLRKRTCFHLSTTILTILTLISPRVCSRPEHLLLIAILPLLIVITLPMTQTILLKLTVTTPVLQSETPSVPHLQSTNTVVQVTQHLVASHLLDTPSHRHLLTRWTLHCHYLSCHVTLRHLPSLSTLLTLVNLQLFCLNMMTPKLSNHQLYHQCHHLFSTFLCNLVTFHSMSSVFQDNLCLHLYIDCMLSRILLFLCNL